MASLQKNVASQNFTFVLVNATTGAADATGTGLAGRFTGDNAAQAACTGTFTNKGNGQYNYAPVQAETNFTDVGFLFTATGDIPLNIDFHTDLTDATGNLQVDAVRINNVATTSVTTVNANQGTTQPVNFTGTAGAALVQTDTRDWLGTVVATPATAGIPDVNAKNINNVATTPVTTINANQGTTQPVNFTGTAGSALVQTDTRDWLGTVVATPATAGIPDINVKNIANAAVSTTTAQVGVNAVQINGVATAPVTTINANQGTTQPINFTGTGGTATVNANITGTVAANVTQIAGAAVNTATVQVGANVAAINGNAAAAAALMNSTLSICWGTASGGSTTTVIASSINNPTSLTDAGQLIGRTIIFLGTTATTHVQSEASNITASTTGTTPTITFTAMTTGPASGDLFVII